MSRILNDLVEDCRHFARHVFRKNYEYRLRADIEHHDVAYIMYDELIGNIRVVHDTLHPHVMQSLRDAKLLKGKCEEEWGALREFKGITIEVKRSSLDIPAVDDSWRDLEIQSRVETLADI